MTSVCNPCTLFLLPRYKTTVVGAFLFFACPKIRAHCCEILRIAVFVGNISRYKPLYVRHTGRFSEINMGTKRVGEGG